MQKKSDKQENRDETNSFLHILRFVPETSKTSVDQHKTLCEMAFDICEHFVWSGLDKRQAGVMQTTTMLAV